MMKIPRIAFIDDGINPKYIPTGVPFENYVVINEEVYSAKPERGFTHCTACYRIFVEHLNQVPYHLVSIKVLENTGFGMKSATITALKWCSENDIDIINMSMGTRQYDDFYSIAEVINRLSNKIIIAACNNNNSLTLPACLPTVIGVRCFKENGYCEPLYCISEPYDQIDIIVNANESIESNSMSVPVVTAFVCEAFSKGLHKLGEIKNELTKNSKNNALTLTYGFYKSILSQWESIKVPVVAIIDNSPDAESKLKRLIKLYVEDGYNAVGLSFCINTDVQGLIFKISEALLKESVSKQALIELYCNYALPDILFMHLNKTNEHYLCKEIETDININLDDLNENSCGDIRYQINKLYNVINEHLL